MGGIATGSTIVRGGLGPLCGVCAVHSETVRTVRTLLALSYGSATNLGIEWRFEGSSAFLLPPRRILPPEAGLCGMAANG